MHRMGNNQVAHSIASTQLAIVAILLIAITSVTSSTATPITAVKSQVPEWFKANVKPLSQRKGTLNATLEAAEANATVIKVRKDGGGDFKTITDAIKSIRSGNTQRVIVSIGAGIYNEMITIAKDKPFVTLAGSRDGKTVLQFGGTAKQYGTVFSATLRVDSDCFVASNMVIKNTAPKPKPRSVGEQAVAFRIGGDMASFYNCRFIGFQDTVCDYGGRHFFKDCYIEGTVDFIFGGAKSLYLGTELNVIGDNQMTVITAQARHKKGENSGFSFVHCSVGGTGTGTYLGRPWMEMPEVVFAYSTISNVVTPAGWFNNFRPEREKNCYFGEYKNTGPGSNPNGRAKFAKQLNDNEAKSFISLDYIDGSKWVLPPPNV